MSFSLNVYKMQVADVYASKNILAYYWHINYRREIEQYTHVLHIILIQSNLLGT